jgi:cytoskeletal protein RodZ
VERQPSPPKKYKFRKNIVLRVVSVFIVVCVIGLIGAAFSSKNTGSNSSDTTNDSGSAYATTGSNAGSSTGSTDSNSGSSADSSSSNGDGSSSTGSDDSSTIGSSDTTGNGSSTGSSSCSPISDEGTCYEPGEYCRDDDHGASGTAGDGGSITCEDNDGWRWEPN